MDSSMPSHPSNVPSEVTALPQDTNTKSYLSKLVGHVPGAYENIFSLERALDDDDSDDDVAEEMDEPPAGQLRVLLTREEKQRLRQPWRSSLIVKLFGKSFELQYFTQRLISLWNPSGNMDCVDLGYGFFLVTFNTRADFAKVIRDGPWFVGRQFLTMRLWEPCFRPSKATFSAVAIWVRLPELPIEFYSEKLLSKLGNRIGPLLRIDSRTYLGVRGKYARLCVQVDLTKPLPTTIWIGDFEQPLQYEGIDQLCFHCGIIGHTATRCPTLVPPPTSLPSTSPSSSSSAQHALVNVSPPTSNEEQTYGPWLIVQNRKRKNPISVSRNLRTPTSLPAATRATTAASNADTQKQRAPTPIIGKLPPPVKTRPNHHRMPRQLADNDNRGKDKTAALITTPVTQGEVKILSKGISILSDPRDHLSSPASSGLPVGQIPDNSPYPKQCSDEGYVEILVTSLPPSSVSPKLPIIHTEISTKPDTNIPSHGKSKNLHPEEQEAPLLDKQNEQFPYIQEVLPYSHQKEPCPGHESNLSTALLGSSTSEPNARMVDNKLKSPTESRRRYDRLHPGAGQQRKATTGNCSDRCLDGDSTTTPTRSRSRSPLSHRGVHIASDCSRTLLSTPQRTESLETHPSVGNNVGHMDPARAVNSNHQKNHQYSSLDSNNKLRDEFNDDTPKLPCSQTGNLDCNMADATRRVGNFPLSDSHH
ncbi:uncharacterized protein LOC116196325 [Punica granatum]|uniref:Uncharacterized protein LOC116196325 n=1 Tax=Punica granatum TaxID=22663 RepID=A0A6P8CD65_PUNGR|nr:uncharacterized protein LOC116196325 [Punica granatum]XP_031381853.1 uncharacterized protein LOC116196325 [Punica granatum]